MKNGVFCGRPLLVREGEGRMRVCPHSKTDPTLFMSITNFSPQNSVYNSIHLLGTAAAGKRGIFWFQFQGCFRCLPLQIDYHFAQPQFLQFLFFCFERAALGIFYRTQVHSFHYKLPFQNRVIFKSKSSVLAFLSAQCLGRCIATLK